ncbi:ATP-binding protein [Streptomyces sp. SCSIO 30461]|uniref:ATP-binding protein n=1 Tax=Streptomyces sp. SCSIO 30461 TaxID=3118085 RepID=UPI0030CD190A
MEFTQLLSSTRRGARLARLLAVEQLVAWGWARGGERTETAALVVAELAANAVRHARLSGRGFRLSLLWEPGRLRVEVTDARGERSLAADVVRDAPGAAGFSDAAEVGGGYGLVIVAGLAAAWGVRPRPPSGKTVWADIDVGRGPEQPPGPPPVADPPAPKKAGATAPKARGAELPGGPR